MHVDERITRLYSIPGRLKSARPPSARPAAPRLRDKTSDLLAGEPGDPNNARPATGKVANVILAGDDADSDGDDGDDANEFLVEEKAKDELDLLTGAGGVGGAAAEAEAVESGGQEHGALVRQILETQKEFEETKVEKRAGVEIVSFSA